jgi:hypothetical protein
MNRKDVIRSLLDVVAFELLQFVKESESSFQQRWVPAAHIKEKLSLNFAAVPIENKQQGEKGWLFAILVRMLEDQHLLEYKKVRSRALYRSISK